MFSDRIKKHYNKAIAKPKELIYLIVLYLVHKVSIPTISYAKHKMHNFKQMILYFLNQDILFLYNQ